jgi:protoporphyrinogen oxidase
MSMAWGFLTRPNRLRAFRTWERDRSQLPEFDDGFENFVVERVGRAAYEQFYRPYVEKVWGLHPSEISRTVAKTRVSTSNPLRTFRRALTPKAKTDRTFLYPKDGLGPLIQRLRDHAAELGVTFRDNQRFDADTPRDAYEQILFSGHLGDIAPTAGLSHRGLYILHLAYPRGTVAENDTWYAPESHYWFGRVSQPSRFSPNLQAREHDILCVEIPEGRWGADQDFLASVDTVTQQLADAGILHKAVAPDDQRQTWLPKVYPMYHRGWLPKWQAALKQAEQLGNVYPIGRQGLFLHCNMDHCVHIAWEATQHILKGGDASGWIGRCPEFLDLRVRD